MIFGSDCIKWTIWFYNCCVIVQYGPFSYGLLHFFSYFLSLLALRVLQDKSKIFYTNMKLTYHKKALNIVALHQSKIWISDDVPVNLTQIAEKGNPDQACPYIYTVC